MPIKHPLADKEMISFTILEVKNIMKSAPTPSPYENEIK